MSSGSCHCGNVFFDVNGFFSDVNYCYCQSCRKLSGGAFSAVARVSKSDFKITKGLSALQSYESSPGKNRYYCKNCLSPIVVEVEGQPEFVRIRLGLLNSEPEISIVGHIWVSEKPKWYKINDELPQHQEWP